MNRTTKSAIHIALMILADQLPFLDADMVDMIMLLLDMYFPDKPKS